MQTTHLRNHYTKIKVFLCVFSKQELILEFRAKFHRHCFRTSNLFRIRITLVPFSLVTSKTNTGTCICTTHTVHRGSLPLVLVLGPKFLPHILSAAKSDSACTQQQNLPLQSGLEVTSENRIKRFSKRGKSVVTFPAKHPIAI